MRLLRCFSRPKLSRLVSLMNPPSLLTSPASYILFAQHLASFSLDAHPNLLDCIFPLHYPPRIDAGNPHEHRSQSSSAIHHHSAIPPTVLHHRWTDFFLHPHHRHTIVHDTRQSLFTAF
ncbi:hypothetical protein C8R45DRAFT_996358 [Mycena sanguinolenta]|nr:hypothetical protein C8R45DRAFT_996358 [Mycena sanguinolenta]